MEADSVFESDLSEGWNIISGSVGELGAASNDANGIAVYGLGDFLEIDSHVLINLDHSGFDIVVSAGFVERDVSSDWQDDIGLGDSSVGLGLISVREHSHQDGFSTSGGNESNGFRVSEELAGHGDDFCLHLTGSGELAGVEGVVENEILAELLDVFLVLRLAVSGSGNSTGVCEFLVS